MLRLLPSILAGRRIAIGMPSAHVEADAVSVRHLDDQGDRFAFEKRVPLHEEE